MIIATWKVSQGDTNTGCNGEKVLFAMSVAASMIKAEAISAVIMITFSLRFITSAIHRIPQDSSSKVSKVLLKGL